MARAQRIVRNAEPLFQRLAEKQSQEFAFVSVANRNSNYHRVDGLPMDKAGLKTSVVFLLAIIGAPIGGYITDKIRNKFLNARMIVPAITSFLTALFLFIGFSFLEGNAQYLFLICFGFTAPMFAAGGSAVTQDVMHPGLWRYRTA